jgi:hypothetical protein
VAVVEDSRKGFVRRWLDARQATRNEKCPERKRERGKFEQELRDARLHTVVFGSGWRDAWWRGATGGFLAGIWISLGWWVLALWLVQLFPDHGDAWTWSMWFLLGVWAGLGYVTFAALPRVRGLMVALAVVVLIALPPLGPDLGAGTPGVPWSESLVLAGIAFAIALAVMDFALIVGLGLRAVVRDARSAVSTALSTVLVPLTLVLLAPLARDPWQAAASLTTTRLVILLAGVSAIICGFALWVVATRTRRLDGMTLKRVPEDVGEVEAELGRRAVKVEPAELKGRIRRNVIAVVFLFAIFRIACIWFAVAIALLGSTTIIVNSELAADWTASKQPHEVVSFLGATVFTSQITLCLMLAAVAAIAFSATVLTAGKESDAFLGPELKRVDRALRRAAVYKAALKAGVWKPEPGWQWSTMDAFLLEDTDRRRKRHKISLWVTTDDDGDGKRGAARYACIWFPESGEVVLYGGKQPAVELLVCDVSRRRMEEGFEDWAGEASGHTMKWLRREALALARPLVAA